MKTSRVVIASIIILITTGIAGDLSATCAQYGKVHVVYSKTDSSNNYSYFYLVPRTTGIPTFSYYVFATSLDSEGAATLREASTSGETVYVVGAAASCPTTGTFRYMGALNYVYKYKDL